MSSFAMKRPVVWLLLGCLLQVASVAGQPTLRGLNSTSPESRRKLLDISGKKEMVRDDTEMVQVPFDCDTGFANWKFGWSNAKKLYCCKKVGRACVHDCKAGKTSQWSNEKKGYCCKTQHLGCKAQEPFDCEAGFADWKYGWSNAKKEYCCQHHDKGCMEKMVAPTQAAREWKPPPLEQPTLAMLGLKDTWNWDHIANTPEKAFVATAIKTCRTVVQMQDYHKGEASNCENIDCFFAEGYEDMSDNDNLKVCQTRCLGNSKCNAMNFCSKSGESCDADTPAVSSSNPHSTGGSRCCMRRCDKTSSGLDLKLTKKWHGWDVYEVHDLPDPCLILTEPVVKSDTLAHVFHWDLLSSSDRVQIGPERYVVSKAPTEIVHLESGFVRNLPAGTPVTFVTGPAPPTPVPTPPPPAPTPPPPTPPVVVVKPSKPSFPWWIVPLVLLCLCGPLVFYLCRPKAEYVPLAREIQSTKVDEGAEQRRLAEIEATKKREQEEAARKKAADELAAREAAAREAAEAAAAAEAARLAAERQRKAEEDAKTAAASAARQAEADRMLADILARPLEFNPNKAEIKDTGFEKIRQLAAVLVNFQDLRVEVQGHTGCKCEEKGYSPCKLMELSRERANTVMEAIKKEGITNEMTCEGFGCDKKVGMKVVLVTHGATTMVMT